MSKENNNSVHILLLEDEKMFARALQKHLRASGFSCEHALDIKTASRHIQEKMPDILLMDLRLPDGNGLDFLQQLREKEKLTDTIVLVMSAYGEMDDAIAALRLGAGDYLKKPFDLEELSIRIQRLLEKNTMRRHLDYSQARERSAPALPTRIIGQSAAIESVRERVQELARLGDRAQIPPTILITGETGTGKDLFARAIHSASERKDRPYVQVDCASLPAEIIESELFGHEKGAFTSAHTTRIGLIEAAEDGVLFLDEIGELAPNLQAKLLAVIERRVLRRVGASNELPVRAWIIAASHRDLPGMMERGEFRSDLYYRLNVLNLHLPALRERGDDIVLLARHYTEQSAQRYRLPCQWEDGVEARLLRCAWPGNIRELAHWAERTVLLGAGKVRADAVPAAAPGTPPPPVPRGAADDDTDDDMMPLEELEKRHILRALESHDGNVSKAARALRITRMALRYRMSKHNIRPAGKDDMENNGEEIG